MSSNGHATTNGEVILPEGIIKEIIKPAEESECERPTHGDECTVHYVGTLKSNGDEFDSSDNHGQAQKFTLGIGQVIKGWDLAISTMKKGEEAKFTISPEYAYGANGLPPKVPENATLVFEVTLVKWERGADIFGDGGVIRTVMSEGLGLFSPGEGATCVVSWKLSTADGEVLDTQDMHEYVVGCENFGPLSKAVNKVLPEMRTGAKVMLRCSGNYAFGDGTYIAELGLKEIFQVEDVSPNKDKSIMKKQVMQGKGDFKPREADEVIMYVQGAFFSATESSPGRKAPGFTEAKLTFTVGNGEVCDALEHAAIEMRNGERAIIICSRPALCAEAKIGLADISKLEGEINLMVFMSKFKTVGKDEMDMTPEERLEFASSRKEMGGKHFKAQRYGLALQRYNRVIELLRNSETIPQADKEVIRLCWLNQAACLLKLSDPRGAKNACSSVLKDEPNNVKALFRRATAYMALGDHSEAASDLRQLLEVDPNNKEAQRLLPEAVKSAKADKQKAEAMVSKMNKAHDGDFAEEQAVKMEIERNTLKPGQVLTVAEQEREWDKAMELAKADLERVNQMKANKKDTPVCESNVTLDSSDVLNNAGGRNLHYVPSH